MCEEKHPLPRCQNAKFLSFLLCYCRKNRDPGTAHEGAGSSQKSNSENNAGLAVPRTYIKLVYFRNMITKSRQNCAMKTLKYLRKKTIVPKCCRAFLPQHPTQASMLLSCASFLSLFTGRRCANIAKLKKTRHQPSPPPRLQDTSPTKITTKHHKTSANETVTQQRYSVAPESTLRDNRRGIPSGEFC